MKARALAFALLLAACATPGPPRSEWTRRDGAPDTLPKDRYECERTHQVKVYWPAWEAGKTRLDRDLFRSCMRARGWVHQDD